MSYASEELEKLPVTEAVHKIKQQVRRQQAEKHVVKPKPSTNPPEGPTLTIHKEIDAAKPLEVDISLDRNVSEVLIQTKENFWTGKHELGADATITPAITLSPNIRWAVDLTALLVLALCGALAGGTVGKACGMVFGAGHGFFGHVVGLLLLMIFAVVICLVLVLISMWKEWLEAERRTDLFHHSKLVRLSDDEADEVFKRLSWHIRNLEVYDTKWLNRVLDKLWPRLRRMVTILIAKQLTKHQVIGKMRELSKGYLDISVLKTSIGHFPPRVSGIRVLGDRTRDVIIDSEITFDDDIDFEVEVELTVYKFKPVVLKLGLKRFFLRFMMRTVVAPLSSDLPLADSLSFFLMERPSLDWSFTGLACILNLRLFKNLIEDVISSLLLYPKSIQIKLLREYLAAESLDAEQVADNFLHREHDLD